MPQYNYSREKKDQSDDDDKSSTSLLGKAHLAHPNSRNKAIVTIWLLVTIIMAQSVFTIWTFQKLSHHMRERPEFSDIGLPFARNKPRNALIPNRFFSPNMTENDASWTAIETGHGIVSITPEHAESLRLPDSHLNPYDTSKRIYILESYHNIHCLRNLRRHYLNLVRGEIPDTEMQHDLHCFDSLRQTLMCDANDNLLAWGGYGNVGVNQTRQCRDWDALRDWATRYTSCYHDDVPKPGEENWQRCDGGTDGLPVGSILG